MDDDLAEDYCFSCKDGGNLRVCDFKNCRKAYHYHCVEKDESFLEDDNTWECPWHLCSTCNEKAVFQCYGCPNSSVCQTCVKEAEFAPVRNSNKGFCRMCLRYAILIEEKKDDNSNGGKVDFDDPENLFRDYWYIIKDSESLSLSDLKAAKRKLKQTGDEEENIYEEDYEPEPEPELGSGIRKRKCKAQLKFNSLVNKKGRSKTRNFIKWGSEELIGFVASIGKDVEISLSRGDVERLVKGYIEQKNLYEPEKKKKFVLCDDRLRALFGKRRVKLSKIYRLLEEHFPGSQADIILFPESDEEQEEEESITVKKRKLNSGAPSHMQDATSGWETFMKEKKMCTAALVRENIKLLYLRQALVLQFLENRNTFEQKIMGCFVRVKHHPKEFYGIPPNLYQIGQVTGVKKDAEPYQVGGMNTDIVIRVSNIHKDVKLSSLADDDFSDKDIEDLQNLVQKGLYKMPTVGEVAEKLTYVHEEITCHWIKKELVRLTKLKQLASEKGWRREMFDYINKIELLRKPEEQERLKKELPFILVDSQHEKKAKEEEEKGEESITTLSNLFAQNKVNGRAEASHQKPVLADGKAEISHQKQALVVDGKAEAGHQKPELADGKAEASHEKPALAGDADGRNADNFTRKPETNEVNSPDSLKSDSSRANYAREPNNCFETPTQPPVQSKKDVKSNNATQQVVDICDSDSDNSGSSKMPGCDERVWYYMDPNEKVQGPYSMTKLRGWGQSGFFDEDFKVWREGQSKQDAVLLSTVSRCNRLFC